MPDGRSTLFSESSSIKITWVEQCVSRGRMGGRQQQRRALRDSLGWPGRGRGAGVPVSPGSECGALADWLCLLHDQCIFRFRPRLHGTKWNTEYNFKHRHFLEFWEKDREWAVCVLEAALPCTPRCLPKARWHVQDGCTSLPVSVAEPGSPGLRDCPSYETNSLHNSYSAHLLLGKPRIWHKVEE